MSTILLIVVVPLLVSIAANFLSEPIKKRLLAAALSVSSIFRNYWKSSDDMARYIQGSATKCVAYFASMILMAIVWCVLSISTLIMFSTFRIIRDINPGKGAELIIALRGSGLLSALMLIVTTCYIYHGIFIGRKIYRAYVDDGS